MTYDKPSRIPVVLELLTPCTELLVGIISHLIRYEKTSFELQKFTLGSEAEGSKRKEMNYSSMNLNAIYLVLYPWASEPSTNFYNSKRPIS